MHVAAVGQQFALDTTQQMRPHALQPCRPTCHTGNQGRGKVEGLAGGVQVVVPVGGRPEFVQVPGVYRDQAQA